MFALKILVSKPLFAIFVRMMNRLCWLSLLSLIGCSSAGEERGAATIMAVNHTTGAINWMSVNGYGVDGGGGSTCCIGLPLIWRPGLKVEVEWEVDPDPFAKIKEVEKGVGFEKAALAAHVANYRRLKKIVEIPEWPEKKSCDFKVHFLPCDRIRVTTACTMHGHPDYPVNDDFGLEEPKVCPK